MAGLRILVADDHEIVRRGVCSILQTHPGWKVCSEAADGREAVDQAQKLEPDVIILDIAMPRLNGLDAARQILRHDRNQRILILTVLETPQLVIEAFEVGARGFLLKSDAGCELEEAVEALQQNRSFFKGNVGSIILGYLLDENGPASGREQPQPPILTPREREIAQLLSEGLTTKEAAAVLNLSVKTAATHRSNAMRKIGAHCLAELVCYAVRNNIILLPPPEPISCATGLSSIRRADT